MRSEGVTDYRVDSRADGICEIEISAVIVGDGEHARRRAADLVETVDRTIRGRCPSCGAGET